MCERLTLAGVNRINSTVVRLQWERIDTTVTDVFAGPVKARSPGRVLPATGAPEAVPWVACDAEASPEHSSITLARRIHGCVRAGES